jgi:hypothetical protein
MIRPYISIVNKFGVFLLEYKTIYNLRVLNPGKGKIQKKINGSKVNNRRSYGI